MGNIVLLDDLTINKIAAGEVIERPASVVKEMVENSIDAGAKNITIEIKNGGISFIRITDDGCGIAEDDMEIAFERHATSKIRRAEDLATVMSMGFRGEALASIAAISKVEMISKKGGAKEAHKIVVEGGKTLEFTEAARNIGTTITVENLFYNTPVRYKFLKKDYTEAGYIEDAVTRIALVNTNVAIKLISNGKTIVQTNGNGELKDAIYSIFGKDISLETKEVDYEYEEIRVSGVIGNPVIARSNRTNQIFFLNGRYIKDKNLTAATDQAYKGSIPVGRYGFVVLNIQMDPKAVDVNVHPSKLEVRFEDESKVFKAIYHAIKSSLTNSKYEIDESLENFNISKTKKNANYSNDWSSNHTKSKSAEKVYGTYSIPSGKVSASNFTNNLSETFDDTNVLEKRNTIDKNNMGFNDKDDKKKSGIVGLFHKIIKEPDETDEERNNNYLEEIYRNNQNLNNNVVVNNDNDYVGHVLSTVKNNEQPNLNNENNLNVNEPIQVEINNENQPKFVNENELNKSINIGNAVISSYTKEIEVSGVNELVREKIRENASKNILTEFAKKQEEKVSKYLENKESILESGKEELENDSIDFDVAAILENAKADNLKDNNSDSDNDVELSGIEKKLESNINDFTEETEFNKEALNEIKSKEAYEENKANENVNSEEDETDNSINLGENKVTQKTDFDTNIIQKQTENEDGIDEENNNSENVVEETNQLEKDIQKEEIDEDTNKEINVEEIMKTSNKEPGKSFDEVAGKLIEAKMNLDNTQMIDTNKVREAEKESREEKEIVEENGKETEEVEETLEEEIKPEFDEMYKRTFGVEPFSVRKEKELESKEKQEENSLEEFTFADSENINVFEDNNDLPISYKFIGMAFDSYIIIEIKDELYIVNQILANSRIIYEKIKANYYSEDERDEQFLLLPDVISLSHKMLLIARENIEMFARAGFAFEEFGTDTIKLVSVPSICENLNTKQLFIDILEQLDKVAVTATEEKESKFIATIADKLAVKLGVKLEVEEAKDLINNLLSLPEPFNNELGKPIAIKMTRYDLERKFSRR